MTDLEISIAVGSVVSASFLIGCILGEFLFRVLRDRNARRHARRTENRERHDAPCCHECCGSPGDAIPVGTRNGCVRLRCGECDRALGGE